MAHDTYHARDAGARLAQTLGDALATPTPPNISYGTVTATRTINGHTRLTVTCAGTTLTDLPCTTTCTSAKTGDRGLLLTADHLTTVIGILA